MQHAASRVGDLGTLVQRANDWRAVTGAGLAFLAIPRTYYGLVDDRLLGQWISGAGSPAGDVAGAAETAEASAREGPGPEALASARAVLAALRGAGLVDEAGAVSLEACAQADPSAAASLFATRVHAACAGSVPGWGAAEVAAAVEAAEGGSLVAPEAVVACLRFSCYRNLHALLGDALTEEEYLRLLAG